MTEYADAKSTMLGGDLGLRADQLLSITGFNPPMPFDLFDLINALETEIVLMVM